MFWKLSLLPSSGIEGVSSTTAQKDIITLSYAYYVTKLIFYIKLQ
jgi:hypothetical protein